MRAAALLLVLAACHRGAAVEAPRKMPVDCECPGPRQVNRPPAQPGIVDVTGSWERVSSASVATVTRCAEGYLDVSGSHDFSDHSWLLVQRAERIELQAESARSEQRGQIRASTSTCETAQGRIDGGALTLTGEECSRGTSEQEVHQGMPPGPLRSSRGIARPLTYALSLEPGTGHLVGTRNGTPFRLAPVVFVKSGPVCHPYAPPSRPGRP